MSTKVLTVELFSTTIGPDGSDRAEGRLQPGTKIEYPVSSVGHAHTPPGKSSPGHARAGDVFFRATSPNGQSSLERAARRDFDRAWASAY